jgi:peptide deformylase
MIYPIVAYGNAILKKEAEEITEGTELDELIKSIKITKILGRIDGEEQ